MVKRLIEQEGLDTVDSQLADLFRAAAPFESDPFRKRRILVRLERSPARSAPRFWMRPVVVAALLVSGTATAALGHRYVFQGSGLLGWLGEPSAPTTNASRLAPLPKHRPSVTAPLSAPTESALQAEAPATLPELLEAQAAPVRPSMKSSVRARADAGEDAIHVVEAIQALRKERDPVRAQNLLDGYLQSHPRGVLSGDALALSIEAASARHDPRAADYARRYLANYPKGKYRELAKRALEAQH